jgi:transposase InsO family protein
VVHRKKWQRQPRAAMSDNGAAMTATEISEGLARLGVLHQTTLPYSPYMNGKQETLWGSVEGGLMAMLEGVDDLTLARLNEATQARWSRTITASATARSTTRRSHASSPALP